MARSVPGIVFGLGDIRLESIVAEIIDNSLDENAKNIELRFFECTSSKKNQDIGFAVFDDGNGFETRDELFDSFEIQQKDKQKSRKDTDIGKYHIGMKIAPLSMYMHLFVLSRIENTIWYSAAHNPEKSSKPYDMDLSPHQNPTKPKKYSITDKTIPQEIHLIVKEMTDKTSTWNTCVVACNRWKNVLEDGKKPVLELLQKTSGAKFFATFLGLTYQKYLEDASPPSIKILDPSNRTLIPVIPIDPFWKEFTPERFEVEKARYQKLHNASIIPAEKKAIQTKINACAGIGKYGTFTGYEHSSTTILGLTVQPHVIPDGKVRTLIKNNVEKGIKWDKDENKAGALGQAKGGPSSRLNSEFVAGFFIYRGKRLINFGKFYDLNVSANDGNAIRIEINYPKTLDDTHFEVSPNKERINTFSDEAWKEILRALEQKEGGSQYAKPFNKELPFFIATDDGLKRPPKGKDKPNKFAHYANILARNGDGGAKYAPCGVCGFVHQKGDTCSQKKCATCGLKAKGCTDKSCKYICKVCAETGKCKPSTCINKCKNCNKIHSPGMCAKKCSGGCGELPVNCKCKCTLCGKVHVIGHCKKVCSECKKEKCDCLQGDSRGLYKGPKVNLYLFKKNKKDNIDELKRALEILGIDSSDLFP